MLKFICAPSCSTCRRARDFLEKRGINYDERNIASENPTRDELSQWLRLSGADIKQIFNVSGARYRELGLKNRIKDMTEQEALDVLSSDGMLVRRPVLVGGDFALFGFMESEWSEKCK